MSTIRLSPMGEILKQEWENGWKARCEKEMKKASFLRAFHYSAKNHIKFGSAHQDFRQLLADFIELESYRNFAKRVQQILNIQSKNSSELQEKILIALSQTPLQVEEILLSPENIIRNPTKSEIIDLWNNKGLAQIVLEESQKTGVRKAFLKVFKELLEVSHPGCPLTNGLYSGVEANVNTFMIRLQTLLEIKGKTTEETIEILYDGRTENIPNFFLYKTSGIKIRTKIKS